MAVMQTNFDHCHYPTTARVRLQVGPHTSCANDRPYDVIVFMTTQELEHEPLIHRAHEVLTVYKAADPEIPLGGLPIRDYEVIRRALAEVPDPSPHFQYDAAWVDIEYLMAASRGSVNPDTEEPFTPRELNSITESARARLRAILKNEMTPPALRAEAQVLLAGIPIHQEVANGRRDGLIGKFHIPYLQAIQAASLELLSAPPESPEDHHTLHRMLIMLALADAGYKSGWALPAASRQPWDVTRHSLKRHLPDLHMVIDGEETDTIINVSSNLFSDDVWPDAGPHASLRHYAQFPVHLDYNTTKVRFGSEAARLAFDREQDGLFAVRKGISRQVNSREDILKRNKPADEVAQTTSKERAIERDICPEATWYLTEFDGVALDDTFVRQLERFNRLRIESGLLLDERRVFGWMLQEYARLLALAGNKDTARLEFGTAIIRLERIVPAFERAHRPGDALDTILGAQAAAVNRGLYTSSDAYGLRRIVETYLSNVSTAFNGADATKAPPGQSAVLQYAIDRASLCLLQAAADAELRHLIVPASPRVNDRYDAVAYPLLYSPKVSRYDLNSPIAITFVEGGEITPGDKTVHVGRHILTFPDDPHALHAALRAVIAPTNGAKGAAKASAAKKGKKISPAPAAHNRSDTVRQVAEQLAYAISDADAWEASQEESTP